MTYPTKRGGDLRQERNRQRCKQGGLPQSAASGNVTDASMPWPLVSPWVPDPDAELARCDRELAEIDTRPDLNTAPAYLIAMGRHDWQREKELIQQEAADA